jgi:iron complex transport system substrate-binding protein
MWSAAARRRIAALSVLAVLAIALTACSGNPPENRPTLQAPPTSVPPAFPVTITDDDGVAVTLERAPERMITWAPSNTEILFALGLGSRIVGVSGSFDDFPPAAKSIAHVAGEGGVVPDVEKVVSLHADLVLNGFEGGDDWKARLRGLGIAVFSIYASTLDDAMHDILVVGQLTGAARAADRVVGTMRSSIAKSTASHEGEPRVSCFFEAYYPPLTTVGPHTFIFDVLSRAGCDPASASAKGDYPQWSVEKLVRDGPLVYLAASESAPSVEAVRMRPGFSGIAAVRDGRVYPIDSNLITRPGPRVVEALAEVVRDLYP